MKKGKTQKINGLKHCKALYGTVDSKEFKSLYINLQTWAEPKTEIEKTEKVVSLLNKEIKQSLSNSIDPEFFKENFIVDLDLRHSGICFGKKSFLNLEVTLFTNNFIDFKNKLLRKKIEELTKTIYKSSFNSNEYFTFHTSKRENSLENA
jgi:hypothetical protein